MALNTLREKRNKLMTDAGKLIQGENVTPEQRTQFDAMMADSDTLEQDIAREERVAKFHEEQRTATRPHREQPGTNAVDTEKRSFRSWMQTGISEQRDLGVGPVAGSITGGSVLVPVGFDPQLHSALKSFGQLVGAVRTLKTDNGGPMRVALENDVNAGLTLVSEAAIAPEVDPAVSGFTSSVDSSTTGIVQVSYELLNDSAFNVDDFIGQKFGRRYFTGLAQWIAQGNGSNVQKLAPGAVVTGTSGEAASVTIDNITDTFGLLDAAYAENASWVMTQTTKVALMKLKDNYGHSFLQPDATGRPFNSIYGRPIVISPYTDQLGANKTPILFGDLEASYTLRMVGGLEIARSTDFLFTRREVVFGAWVRVGGYNTSQASSPSLVGFTNSAS